MNNRNQQKPETAALLKILELGNSQVQEEKTEPARVVFDRILKRRKEDKTN